MNGLMKGYKQLTEIQRYQIGALKKAGQPQNAIAAIIGVSAPTLGRELKRNTGKRGYRPKQANIKAHNRRQPAGQGDKNDPGSGHLDRRAYPPGLES